MKTKLLCFFLCSLALAWAQSTSEHPARLRRASGQDPLNMRVDEELKELQRGSVPVTPPPALASGRGDTPLAPAVQSAVKAGEKWLTGTVTPAVGPDGRVVFVFGGGLPTLVCAPFRICLIELQQGEHLTGEPQIGDSVRWNITPAAFGKTDTETSVIVVKPQEAGLDTNLLLTTDRRAYYIRLVSKPEDYIARVAFSYTADELAAKKWQEHLARQEAEQRSASRVGALASPDLESVNFEYEVAGPAAIRPIQVFDDGVKTYIRLPASAMNRETPVLMVIGADGKPEMLNYRVKGSMYIVDRLLDRARMVTGSGKKAEKVEIVRANHKP